MTQPGAAVHRPRRREGRARAAGTAALAVDVSSIRVLLRSPRLALGAVAFLAGYSAVAAWMPWSRTDAPHPWAAAIGLDHPFSAWPFLAAVALLFASTLACTWGRRARIAAIARGELPSSAIDLEPRGKDIRAFLAARGYRGEGQVLRRFGFALWGGWVLHVGLLVLIAAILVQQAFHDEAAFDLTEGETARLSDPGAVLGRVRGPLAPASPPDLRVRLERFDPFLRQEGYAPDRLSRLSVAREGKPGRVETLDRATGVRVGLVEIFQAIPTGLAVNVEIAGMGTRSIHLASESDRLAGAALNDPAGRPARFVVTAERTLDDRMGTGRLRVELEQDGRRVALEPGAAFSFGGREARIASIGRWGRFTYSRSPGMPAVFVGFILVLAGCALLAFPAGVAWIGAAGAAPVARMLVVRGRSALLSEWRQETARAAFPVEGDSDALALDRSEENHAGHCAMNRPSDELSKALERIRALAPSHGRLRVVEAIIEFDDGWTWWDLMAVFALPDSAPRCTSGWHREVSGEHFCEHVVADLPGHLYDCDAPRFRGPVEELGTALALALGARFFIPPAGSFSRWWEADTSSA